MLEKNYYDQVDIYVYDRTISCHPLVDACNALIAYRLLENLGIPCNGKRVLDVGSGSGQMARFLKGIPGMAVEACDIDPKAKEYFRLHPELKDITFHHSDFMNGKMPSVYDAITCRGVYHHIPKSQRPKFLQIMKDHADVVIVADEGILEYDNEEERKRNCDSWYGFVISEARRRGIDDLALIEAEFLRHEYLETAEDGGDFKESPSKFLEDASSVGLIPLSLDRLGDWKLGGGFYVATFI